MINLQEQKITRTFLFAFLMLMDLLSELVIVAFAAPRKTATEPGNLNIADIVGLVSGKKLLHAYHRRFPSLMNIFIREKGITSVFEPRGLIQTPSSELILGLYDQCRAQISQDIQNEKGRYTELEHPEMDERLSRLEIENGLKSCSTIGWWMVPCEQEILRPSIKRWKRRMILCLSRRMADSNLRLYWMISAV